MLFSSSFLPNKVTKIKEKVNPAQYIVSSLQMQGGFFFFLIIISNQTNKQSYVIGGWRRESNQIKQVDIDPGLVTLITLVWFTFSPVP